MRSQRFGDEEGAVRREDVRYDAVDLGDEGLGAVGVVRGVVRGYGRADAGE